MQLFTLLDISEIRNTEESLHHRTVNSPSRKQLFESTHAADAQRQTRNINAAKETLDIATRMEQNFEWNETEKSGAVLSHERLAPITLSLHRLKSRTTLIQPLFSPEISLLTAIRQDLEIAIRQDRRGVGTRLEPLQLILA